jgi:hypothetical protein
MKAKVIEYLYRDFTAADASEREAGGGNAEAE